MGIRIKRVGDAPQAPPKTGEVILYQTGDGQTRLQVQLFGGSVWLSLNQLADLFQRDKSVISKHIRNIFQEGELDRPRTVAKFATVQAEGSRQVQRAIEYYRLEVILAVGYRVNSPRGTQFRQWATARLEEYVVKGFTMDDERLKQSGGGDYFDELLARIRDIRSSERIFWRKILDIYATSVDYDPRAEASQRFFQIVQNKMHWAAHGQTAAEVIASRADATQPNMGLTTWAGAATGSQVKRTDVGIAKNYLDRDEIETLNLIVSTYLDFAELQARNRRPMAMQDWIAKLDEFLRISDRELLAHAGTVSHETAVSKALQEYDKYRALEDQKPHSVDAHFQEAIEKAKALNLRARQNHSEKRTE